MSITVDYFFNSPAGLHGLAEDISAVLGCSLEPYEGDPDDLYARFLGMEFSLSTHELENDRELHFEDFCYEIGFKTPMGNAACRPIQLPAILTAVYLLHLRLGLTGMLVYDVHTLLAEYDEREVPGCGRRLYDRLSETVFLNFVDHLDVVRRRLPADTGLDIDPHVYPS